MFKKDIVLRKIIIILLFSLGFFSFSICFANNKFFKIQNVYYIGFETNDSFSFVKKYLFSLKKSEYYPLDVDKIRKELINYKVFLDVSVEFVEHTLVFVFLEYPLVFNIILNNITHEKKFLKLLRRKNYYFGMICVFEQLFIIKDFIKVTYLFYYGFYHTTTSIIFVYNIVSNNVMLYFFLGNYKKSSINVLFFSNSKFFKISNMFKYFFFYKKKYLLFFTKFDKNFSSKNLVNYISALRSYFYENGYFNFTLNYFYIYPSINVNFLNVVMNSCNGNRFVINSILIKSICHINMNFFYDFFEETFFSNYYFFTNYLLNLQKIVTYRLREFGFFSESTFIRVVLNRNFNFIDINFFIFCNVRTIVENLNIFNNAATKLKILLEVLLRPSKFFVFFNEFFLNNVFLKQRAYILTADYFFNRHISGAFISFEKFFMRIKEEKQKSFSGNFTYNFSNGLIFTTVADLVNFIGSEKNFKFFFEKNVFNQDYNFQYYDPCFLSKYIGFGFNLCFLKKNLTNILYKKFNYIVSTSGCNLFFIIPFLKHKIIMKFGYVKSFLNYYNKDMEFEKGRFLSFEGCVFSDFYFSCNFEFSSFNKLWFPSSGFLHDFKFYFSLPFSDLKYIRFDYFLNFFKNLYYDFILQILINFCVKRHYGNTYMFPFFKETYFKNPLIFKGFKENTLSKKFLINLNETTIIYSQSDFFITIRISMVIPKKFFFKLDTLRNYIFFDCGYFPNKSFFDVYFKSSFGFVFSWYTPFGIPIEFYSTYPLFFCDFDQFQYFTISFANT